MNIAIILAGGTGTRLGGDIPKQYLVAGGRMIIEYCIETILNNHHVDGLIIGADSMWHDSIADAITENTSLTAMWEQKFIGFSMPGMNRQLSIWNAMQLCKACDTVLIHDAARPSLSSSLIDSMYEQLEGHDGVMPVLPMKDTVYWCEAGGRVSGLLDRSRLFAGQAPELFCYDAYYKACKALLPDKILAINGSSEPAIMAGLDIITVPGEEGNYKITTRADFDKYAASVSQ